MNATIKRMVTGGALVMLLAAAPTAFAGHCCPQDCCKPVCCPPPPVKVELCIVDPCTGCTYKECVCVPACCADQEPCVDCRPGLFGRKVLTYTWPCCDHQVKVIITKHGRVIVRD
ncbi:MAG: hypothetical protein KatS3mg111_0336 [Pirellulaceae bacterium]|nr:MAG: hypothetical protein KatS3mg111_0336 [Pirellulaceae bacterium]